MKYSPGLTAAAYIRVSTEEQIEYSPDSQLKRIREYAVSRKILLPDDYIYVDEGISGRSADNRPAFLQMIGTAKQKPRPFELILVWKFSRFARNRQDSILYKSMLRKECGINVVSVTEQLSDDPTSILIEALLEAMDEYYSINLAQEVRRGMNEKFSRGGVVSIPPFGYRMGEEHYEQNPDTAPILRMIFADFLEGMTFSQIAEKLNRQNIRTSRGNFFQARTVRYILQNPVYTGCQRRHLDESRRASMTIVQGMHTPLITEEDFLAVQKRIHALRQVLPPRSRTAPAAFMLRGLVRCSCCGSTLTQSQKGTSLQCCRYGRGQCPESHSISLGKLNRAVLRQIASDFPPELELLPADSSQKDQKSAKKLLRLLSEQNLSENIKNQLLRSFISEIIFYRRENRILIRYHT